MASLRAEIASLRAALRLNNPDLCFSPASLVLPGRSGPCLGSVDDAPAPLPMLAVGPRLPPRAVGAHCCLHSAHCHTHASHASAPPPIACDLDAAPATPVPPNGCSSLCCLHRAHCGLHCPHARPSAAAAASLSWPESAKGGVGSSVAGPGPGAGLDSPASSFHGADEMRRLQAQLDLLKRGMADMYSSCCALQDDLSSLTTAVGLLESHPAADAGSHANAHGGAFAPSSDSNTAVDTDAAVPSAAASNALLQGGVLVSRGPNAGAEPWGVDLARPRDGGQDGGREARREGGREGERGPWGIDPVVLASLWQSLRAAQAKVTSMREAEAVCRRRLLLYTLPALPSAAARLSSGPGRPSPRATTLPAILSARRTAHPASPLGLVEPTRPGLDRLRLVPLLDFSRLTPDAGEEKEGSGVKIGEEEVLNGGGSGSEGPLSSRDEASLPLSARDREEISQSSHLLLQGQLEDMDSAVVEKEHLLEELVKNQRELDTMRSEYERQVEVFKESIRAIEQERDKVLSSLSSVEKRTSVSSAMTAQAKEDRERWVQRLRQLEDELRLMRNKVKDHERLVSFKEHGEQKIAALTQELNRMKHSRSTLHKRLTQEAKGHRDRAHVLERTIASLRKESQASSRALRTLQTKLTLASRAEHVLRRKAQIHQLQAQRQQAGGVGGGEAGVGGGGGGSGDVVAWFRALVARRIARLEAQSLVTSNLALQQQLQQEMLACNARLGQAKAAITSRGDGSEGATNTAADLELQVLLSESVPVL